MTWVAVNCRACGAQIPRILRSKAEKGICPYCGKKALEPKTKTYYMR